jgi:predicted DNA repair protein MutK
MSGFLALLDDIAALMDDVAIMTKVATKKTAGILGDDLAVGAEKASSFRASRELPVIWAITKGSFVNKLIILPFVFLLSAFLPQLIVPILLIGGIYLSFEGVEKIINTFFYKKKHAPAFREIETEAALSAVEKSKIKSAIITDFILSLEIIMIALGTLKNSSLLIQVVVVSLVAVIATIGVYGIVALMVRIDDIGFRLIKISENNKGFFKIIYHEIGTSLVWLLPKLIQLIAIIGTLAMLLVGGGLFVHNISAVHDLFHGIPSVISELIMGLLVGFISSLFFKIGSILKELYKSKM